MILDIITLQADITGFFETQLIDPKGLLKLFVNFTFNFAVVAFIVRALYFPIARRKDYMFSYLLISNVIFLLCFLVNTIEIGLGLALGLFAVFTIIRYRTNPIPIKEMTYLFVVIGVSVVNALANKKISHAELIFANLMIVFVTFGMERIWLLKGESRKNYSSSNNLSKKFLFEDTIQE